MIRLVDPLRSRPHLHALCQDPQRLPTSLSRNRVNPCASVHFWLLGQSDPSQEFPAPRRRHHAYIDGGFADRMVVEDFVTVFMRLPPDVPVSGCAEEFKLDPAKSPAPDSVSQCIFRQCGHAREVSTIGFVSLPRSIARCVTHELELMIPTSCLYAVSNFLRGSGRRWLSSDTHLLRSAGWPSPGTSPCHSGNALLHISGQ